MFLKAAIVSRHLEKQSQEREFLSRPDHITLGSATNCVVLGSVVDKQSSFPSYAFAEREDGCVRRGSRRGHLTLSE